MPEMNKNGNAYLTAFVIAVTIIGILVGFISNSLLQGSDVSINKTKINQQSKTLDDINDKLDVIGKDITQIKVSIGILKTNAGMNNTDRISN